MRKFIALVVVLLLLVGNVASPEHAAAHDAALIDLLPTSRDIAPGFSVIDEGIRSLPDYASTFTDPEEALGLLTEWGWQENVFRFFQAAQLPANETAPAYVQVSLSRFQSANGAWAALPYATYDRATLLGHRGIPTRVIGEKSREIIGPVGGRSDITLYVQSGPLLMRISMSLWEGNPVADPDHIAEQIIALADVVGFGQFVGTDSASSQRQAVAGSASTSNPSDPQTDSQRTCDPSYPNVCIPPVWEVGDLDCQDVPYGDFRVIGADPHRFDGPYDGSNPNEPDGRGCELK